MIISPERLADLLETNNWFRAGSPAQRGKLFEEYANGLSLEGLTGAIWICSGNVPREQILSILKEEEQKVLDEIVKELMLKFGYYDNNIFMDDPYVCYDIV